MTQIALRLYIGPGAAEILISVGRLDGGFERLTAIIDTGAAVTLLPAYLMADVEHRLEEKSAVVIEQAGIAQQAFKATAAIIRLFLEDELGAQSEELEVPVWFADTQAILIGFEGVLDRAILHIDMLNRSGWIEI